MPAMKVRKKGDEGPDGDHAKKKKPPKIGGIHKNKTEYVLTKKQLSGQMVMFSKSGKRLFKVPYAPQEVSHTMLQKNWSEVERASKAPVLIKGRGNLRKMSMTMVVAHRDNQKSVEPQLERLSKVARSNEKIRVKYGKMESSGLWRVTQFDVTSTMRNRHGRISRAEVTLEFTSTGSSSAFNGPASGGKGKDKDKDHKPKNNLIGSINISSGPKTVGGPNKIDDITLRNERDRLNDPGVGRILKPRRKIPQIKPINSQSDWHTVGVDRPDYYRWKKGDTLHGVCIRFYGGTHRMNDLARINNIIYPRRGLKPGSLIVLP